MRFFYENEIIKKIFKIQTKLSSAGLVYAHYGHEVIAQILHKEMLNEEDLNKLYERLYKNFVQSIDAIDNGIQQFDGPARFEFLQKKCKNAKQ